MNHREQVHHIAGFLRATARRVKRDELSKDEIVSRLEDCAGLLVEDGAVPCTYEARASAEWASAAWCRVHGWGCPNLPES